MTRLKQLETVWRLGGLNAVKKWIIELPTLDLPTRCGVCTKTHVRQWIKSRAHWQPVYMLMNDEVIVRCSSCSIWPNCPNVAGYKWFQELRLNG